MVTIGRKPLVKGVRQADIDPAQREGTKFKQVRMSELLIKRIEAYAEANGLKSRPAAIAHALDIAEGRPK